MQISDMLNQYNQNTATGATAVSPRQGIQQLVAAVREMTVGNVFEGTVNQVKHGEVTLGLVNGQTIQARVAGNVKLSVGQSMFFQVKSNDGSTVEIRPYTNGNLDNPTLLKALDAAGIPASEQTIEMVNAMMEEQLSIDRGSIQTMAKNVAGFEQENMKDLVQMSKLGIPITRENVLQFFNYKQDQAAITGEFEHVLNGMEDLYRQESLGAQQLADISGRIWQVIRGEEQAPLLGKLPETDASGWSPAEFETNGTVTQAEQEPIPVPASSQEESVSIDDSVILTSDQPQKQYMPHTLGAVLTPEQHQEFSRMLDGLKLTPEQMGNLLKEDGSVNTGLSVHESMEQLDQIFHQLAETEKGTQLRAVLTSREYQSVLRDAVEQRWTIEPERVQKDTVKRLYENLQQQLKQMDQIIKDSGQQNTPLAKAVDQLQGNLEFMSQINQTYQFVQIPLQLAGQTAQSELYVYTNKKQLEDPEGELSAFLHLEMEHLGTTDVSVKMINRQVHTDFYMEDERSFALVEAHGAKLARRLEEKGYQCGIHVESRKQKMDFVEDFLNKDQPAGGVLHRYSFDVRA